MSLGPVSNSGSRYVQGSGRYPPLLHGQDIRNRPDLLKMMITKARAAGIPPELVFMTMGVESAFRNNKGGDRDSVGLFQQRPSQGWGTPEQCFDPEHAVDKFIAEARGHIGQFGATNNPERLGQWCQAVQRSAFPGRYQSLYGEARRIVDAVDRGEVPGGKDFQVRDGGPDSRPVFGGGSASGGRGLSLSDPRYVMSNLGSQQPTLTLTSEMLFQQFLQLLALLYGVDPSELANPGVAQELLARALQQNPELAAANPMLGELLASGRLNDPAALQQLLQQPIQLNENGSELRIPPDLYEKLGAAKPVQLENTLTPLPVDPAAPTVSPTQLSDLAAGMRVIPS